MLLLLAACDTPGPLNPSLDAGIDDDGIEVAGGLRIRSPRGFGRGALQCVGDTCTQEDADGVTVWWRVGGDRVQQGWTLPAPTDGLGGVALPVALDGAIDLEISRRSGSFSDAEGRPWRVDPPAAWDARHRRLSVHYVPTEAGFTVVVDPTGADWPVTVDPVYTTAATTLSESEGFGAQVDWADVNGDGYDDALVAAPNFDTSVSGRAYVFHGSAGGLSSSYSTRLEGGDTPNFYGRVIRNAGDTNGDGYEDVLSGDFNDGGVNLYLGSATGLSTTATAVSLAEAAYGSYYGYDHDGIGDVNGDGYADVAVGAYEYGESGGVAVFYGSAGGLTEGTTLTGEASGDDFGYAVAGIGDVNGDGYADLAVYAFYGDSPVSIFLGSATGIAATASSTISEPTSSSHTTQAMGPGGDVDGDGYDDLVLCGWDGSVNEAWVYHGSATGLSSAPTEALVGGATGSAGTCVSSIGDSDGNGYADVAFTEGDNNKTTHVFDGSSAGVETTAVSTISSTKATWVAMDGDTDGDGKADLLVGVEDSDKAYLFLGSCRDADGDGLCEADDCDDADASVLGVSPWYLDADGDGVGDAATSTEACDPPDGYVGDGTDCDDGDAAVGTPSTWFSDADGDGVGDSPVEGCAQPAGTSALGGDCDDTRDDVYPGAVEAVGDATDGDCDGEELCYSDRDGDGYTDGSTTATRDLACAHGGYGDAGMPAGDCDDTNAAQHPGATDRPDDGVDQDCDGVDATTDTGGDTDTGEDTGTGGDTDTNADSGTGGDSDSSGTDDSGRDTDTGGIDSGVGTGDSTQKPMNYEGCNCSTAPGPGGWTGLLLLAVLALRRRGRGVLAR